MEGPQRGAVGTGRLLRRSDGDNLSLRRQNEGSGDSLGLILVETNQAVVVVVRRLGLLIPPLAVGDRGVIALIVRVPMVMGVAVSMRGVGSMRG